MTCLAFEVLHHWKKLSFPCPTRPKQPWEKGCGFKCKYCIDGSFIFQGNQTLTSFLSQHVSIIKLILFCPPALYFSQGILSVHKFPVWFTVRFAFFWPTIPAVLYLVKETVRLYCLSTPPRPSSCTSSQMTGSWNTQPRLLSDLATLQPPPPPALNTVKRIRRERECQGVGGGSEWLVRTFN